MADENIGLRLILIKDIYKEKGLSLLGLQMKTYIVVDDIFAMTKIMSLSPEISKKIH